MVEIQDQIENDIFVIKIDGDVDASSSIFLDKAIGNAIESGFKKVMVDCHNLSYISSAGLGVFMSYIEEFESNEIQLVLFGLSDKVLNVFQILGLDQLLKITDSKDQGKQLVNEL
jgi:anti-sigma B factor antagonist